MPRSGSTLVESIISINKNVLDLGENNISNLPEYLPKLPNLKWLVLKGNPIYEDGSLKSNDRLKYEYES